MAHPNEDLARRGYDAFSRGDMDTLRDLLAPDVVWHSPGRNPTSGDARGIDETLQTFQQLFELTEGSFSAEIHDVLANDEHLVVLGRTRAKRGGKSLEQRFAQVQHIVGGKVTESWFHNEDQHAVDEFFS